MAEGVWVVLVRHTSGLRTVGVEADVVLMITYINREAEGRIREILKDKKKNKDKLWPQTKISRWRKH